MTNKAAEMRCYDIHCQNCRYSSMRICDFKQALELAEEHAIPRRHRVDVEMRLKIHVETIRGDKKIGLTRKSPWVPRPGAATRR